MSTTIEWRRQLLADLHAPATNINLRALSAWAMSEGMSPAYNNPLATTLPATGSHPINSDGVQAYQTTQQGAEAIADTLTGSTGQGYEEIIAALRQGTDSHQIWAAINKSKWCAGCQEGKYPVALYNGQGNLNEPNAPGATAQGNPIKTENASGNTNPLDSEQSKDTWTRILLYIALAAAGALLIYLGLKRTTGDTT